MKRLAEIVAVYERLDRHLEQERSTLNVTVAAKLVAIQVLNDQAYFLLCWGQLEIEIDARCRDAIRQRRASADGQVRRGWDVYNPDDNRLSGLSFEDRAALVLDRAGGKGSSYAKTMTHYQLRNKIAHGKLELTCSNVVSVGHDFYGIQSALYRSG